ncbi:proto-oncogene vav-like, partial [Neopelma chrysocephalum]|uniref:proto-oncogene vav-like n=1 Tax=Neopelma chrysocephalum TaxID=114329 RepID=UPI000FCCFE80
YGFLLDKALIICKRRGDSYEAKDVVDLQSHRLRDGALGPRDGKKWSPTFILMDTAGLQDYELFFKTQELKKKWLEQFEMALSNIFPEHALADGHDFQMFSFEDTTSCRACQMLLRGTFYQGYRCNRCRAPAHKECLGRVGTCGKAGADSGSGPRKNKSQRPGPDKKRGDLGLPKVETTQPYSGVPPPPGVLGPPLRLSPGDVIEVTAAEAEELWWQGRNVASGDQGWFPSGAVRPFVPVPLPDLSVYPWYAGPMERAGAEQVLAPRSDGAFLVRQRVKDSGEFAISIKYRGEVKHIKVMTGEGLYRVTDKKVFKGLVELVEFYRRSSLRDCFKALDTTLVVPFKEPESRAGPRALGTAWGGPTGGWRGDGHIGMDMEGFHIK